MNAIRSFGNLAARRLALLLIALLVVPTAGSAEASFPGANGPLLLRSGVLLYLDGSQQELEWNPYNSRFAPGGERVAYAVPSSDYSSFSLRIRHRHGTQTEVATFPDYVEEVTWSPDGQQLAVQTSGGGTTSIYQVAHPGAVPNLLVTGTTADQISGADWDPTEDRIAYARGSDIFTVPSSGGASTNHTQQCTHPEGDWENCSGNETVYRFTNLEWSPDGTKLTSHVQESAFPADKHYLGVLTLGSRVPAKVADISDDESYAIFTKPLWSPDGKLIAFNGKFLQDGEDHTYVVPADGGTPEKVGPKGALDWQPCPSGTCPSWAQDEPPLPTQEAQTISLALRRHVIALGAVGSSAAQCRSTTVVLQRRAATGWSTIKTVDTAADGSYRQGLPDRRGRYRALVGTTSSCMGATSPVRRHTH